MSYRNLVARKKKKKQNQKISNPNNLNYFFLYDKFDITKRDLEKAARKEFKFFWMSSL